MVLTEGYNGLTSFVRYREAPDEMLLPLVEAGFKPEHYVEGCDAFRQIIPGSHFGAQWDDYIVALFGLQLPDGLRSEGRSAPLVMTFSLSDGDVDVEVWRRIVRTSLSPAFVDARWNPDDGSSVSIAGVEAITRLTDLQPATRGIRLLKEMDKRGKKSIVSRDYPDRESLRSGLALSFAALRRNNCVPTPALIAGALPCPKSQRRVEELVREYELREWYDDAMRQARANPER